MKKRKNTGNIWDRLERDPDGFLAPEGYLEDLEHRLLSGAEGPKTARDRKPLVLDPSSVVYRAKEKAGQASEHGFRVPEGYFDGLEKRLIDRSYSQRNDRNRLDRNRMIALSIAASLLLLIGIRYYGPHSTTEDHTALSTSEIETWIDNGLVTFSSYDIAETYSDVELYPYLGSEQEVLDYLGEVDVENLMTEN